MGAWVWGVRELRPLKFAEIGIVLGMLIFMTCAPQAQNRDADLVPRAVSCLVAKGFLQPSKTAKTTFGYLPDEKSYPGKQILYIVDYLNPSQRNGSVFTVFVTKQDRRRDFNIQNNARFVLDGVGGVSFVTPPLGGAWTQKHLVSAIKAIEKQPRYTISVENLVPADSFDSCRSYTDMLPRKDAK